MSSIEVKSGYFNSFDDNKIYYESRGQGKPMVFVYGIGCLFNHWIHQINHFSKTHQVIIYDFRGHHKSDTPEGLENLDMVSMAKDLKCLLDHLKVDQATFIGHSFGGQVIIETYNQYPEIFDNIIFINGFIKNPIEGMFGSDLPLKAFKTLKKGHEILPFTMDFLWKLILNNPIFIPFAGATGGFNLSLTPLKDIEIYSKGLSNIDVGCFLKLFEEMMTYDGRSVLESIKVPTLIISGDKDNVTPRSHQLELHNLIKNSEYITIPYGSHCTQLDLPVFVNLKIEQFLA